MLVVEKRTERAVAMDFLKNLLPANLGRYLRGIDFPISKQDLLRRLGYPSEPAATVEARAWPPIGVVGGW